MILYGLEDTLNLAESFFTPYIWGEYNVVVMPANFPIGGMENPLITFVSPTIMTQDMS